MSKNARPEAYSDVAKGIGERIGWVRELVEKNQSKVARALGVDASHVNKIEAGTRTPSIFYIIEIANRFRVSTDFLLRGLLVADTDPEMALLLGSQHPELADQLVRRGLSKGMGQA